MRWSMGWICVLLATLPLGAQQRVEEVDLPRSIADSVIAFFNRPTTVRFQGRAEIPEGGSVVGDVAVLGGPVLVAGTIDGELVVVNGTLTVREGGRITGDVTVVGGRADLDPSAVGGQLTVYDEALPYQRHGNHIAYDESPWGRWEQRRRQGHSYLSVRAAGNYNRVEGFPVMFGPVFRTFGDRQFRVEALAIWKSESGIRLAPREMGYSLRAEQHFGMQGRFSAGLTAHSRVVPIERKGLLDIEASLAAFLLHRDYRDYYERKGFSAFARYDDEDRGAHAELEYRDDKHSFVPVGSPWTIKRNDAPWRPQPLIAEGRLRTLNASLILDNRNDHDDPTDGWYLEAHGTVGVSGDLAVPEYFLAAPDPATVAEPSRPVDTSIHAGSLDLRRYARLGPGADIRLRGFAAGALGDAPLPAQFQHTLGGEGSLPGFALMSLDCGARSATYSVFRQIDDVRERMPVFGSYGCDRVALFQAEYRSTLSFNFGLGPGNNWDDSWDWYPGFDFTPAWSVFFDAGRGWSLSDPSSPSWFGSDTPTRMDAGLGLHLGELGLYWAWPLNGENRNVNFFLRIDHRF